MNINIHNTRESQFIFKKKIFYPECPKDNGYHIGEASNIICLNPDCKENSLCCSACIEETHLNHKFVPLKVVLDEINEQLGNNPQKCINIEQLMMMIETSRQTIMYDYKELINSINMKTQNMIQLLQSFFDKLKDQLYSKSYSQDQVKLVLEKIYTQQQSYQDLKNNVNQLIQSVPINSDSDQQNNEEIKESIQVLCQFVQDNLSEKGKELVKVLESQNKFITTLTQDSNVFESKITFTFSQQSKHASINITDPYTVKSQTSSGYKFAIMEPALNAKGIKKRIFAFKLKEVSSSNWIAVGVCHKKLIISKNYNFTFSNLGHGGYMISSNGGTWSNHETTANNLVKSFYFNKNDVVVCEYNPIDMKLIFTKKGGSIYTLNIQNIEGDALHPCVLFYYGQDEIEFINNYVKKA